MAKKNEIKTKGGAHLKKNQYLDGLNHCCCNTAIYQPSQVTLVQKLDLAFYIVASHI